MPESIKAAIVHQFHEQKCSGPSILQVINCYSPSISLALIARVDRFPIQNFIVHQFHEQKCSGPSILQVISCFNPSISVALIARIPQVPMQKRMSP